ncbi:GNAT family N-acetyltransferase [Janibacter sp. DB-40]|uniref:GNAT family N-acetyltransferase n=1 Tax=Janibacter sp. DB-40 TaxID=3028808 RepID=UPI002405EF71|nr:GNAT family N-acetyltransferase [Janibacter sp. DB-40]
MTHTPFVLPAGADDLTARPLETADAEAVTALARGDEMEVLAEPMTELVDVIGEWRRPSVDLERDTVSVWSDGRLVAHAFVAGRGSVEAVVAADHRGRGLGTALVAWLRAASAARGLATMGQTVPVGSPAQAFLVAAGARATYDSWVLELLPDRTVPTQPLPGGHALDLARDDELPAVHRVIDDAFSVWPEREPVPYADWHAEFVEGDDAAPWQRRVVRDGAGEVVGAAMVTASEDGMVWVNQLAVRSDRRGEGLGRALLADSFLEGRRRGLPRAGLSTDSRTGALPLYEGVGMVVSATFTHLVLDVGDEGGSPGR